MLNDTLKLETNISEAIPSIPWIDKFLNQEIPNTLANLGVYEEDCILTYKLILQTTITKRDDETE
jgi:hypothetical protein